MHPGQELGGLLLASGYPGLVDITQLGYVYVDRQPIGYYDGSLGYYLLDERQQVFLGGVRNRLEPDSPYPFASDFGSNHNQGLLSDVASSSTLLAAPNERFVHLDLSLEKFPPRAHHGPAQFVKAHPCGPVAAQTQCPLKSQSADADLLIGDKPHGTQPQPQGEVA